MIFEYFYSWNEEKIGLIGGISFVILGVLIYLIYMIDNSTLLLISEIIIVLFSALTALFFQLPRIKGIKPGISTFMGGVTLGISIISWGYSLSLIPPESWTFMGEIAALMAGLLISSFFGFGFLFIALTPMERQKTKPFPEKKSPSQTKKMGVKEFKEDDEFIDRL